MIDNLIAYGKMSDDDLMLTIARTGDEIAFAVLFERYRREILEFLTRYVGNQAIAETLTQETFSFLFDTREHFTEGRSWRSWVYTIATNQATRWQEWIESNASNLEKKYRVPVRLIYVQQMTYDEAAEALRIPSGVVQNLAHQGLRRLKDMTD